MTSLPSTFLRTRVSHQPFITDSHKTLVEVAGDQFTDVRRYRSNGQLSQALALAVLWVGGASVGLQLRAICRTAIRRRTAARWHSAKRKEAPKHTMWGDVAVMPPQESVEAEANAQLLLQLPYVRSVAILDQVGVAQHRVKGLRRIAGEASLEITYKECGLHFRLDLAKRLSRLSRSQGGMVERQRICRLVHDGERVLVLGSGFGLTACLIGALTPCSEVIAVEPNLVAHEFAVANIVENNLEGAVRSIFADPLTCNYPGQFNRVSAFLPFHRDGVLQSLAILALVVEAVVPGGTLHCYTFETEEEFVAGPAKAENQMAEACRGRKFERTWRGKVPRKPIGRNGFRVGYDFRLL